MLKIGGKATNGEKRVLRGGCWINNARNCRSANRNANDPANRNNNIGFRFAQLPWQVCCATSIVSCLLLHAAAKCCKPPCVSNCLVKACGGINYVIGSD